MIVGCADDAACDSARVMATKEANDAEEDDKGSQIEVGTEHS